MRHILILRFSSLGDVAATVPVINHVCCCNPQDRFHFITKAPYRVLFPDISNLTIHEVSFQSRYRGFFGIWRLFFDLKKTITFNHIIDLHDVIRSWIFSIPARFFNIPIFTIDKERKRRKQLIRHVKKNLEPLTPLYQKYQWAFKQAGFLLNPSVIAEPVKYPTPSIEIQNFLNRYPGRKIGLAPFSRHFTKTLPYEKTLQILDILATRAETFFIFGKGPEENQLAQQFSRRHENIISLVDQFTLQQDLEIIGQLNCMITVDSANMLLAALHHIPLIIIWGGTHPAAGFIPSMNREKRIDIVMESLECQPCSIFGTGKCYRGSLDCFNLLDISKLSAAVDKISSD